jgi:microcystin-dependent protein
VDPFVGQIKPFAFNFAPRGWALCQGQLMAISQNTALFSILGTNFGGDGRSTFGLPDLRGATPIGVGQLTGGQNYVVGETGGEPSVTVLQSEMPMHNHQLLTNTTDGAMLPSTGNRLAKAAEGGKGGGGQTANAYSPSGPNAMMAPNTLSTIGGSQPHNNMQPFLSLNYCIALQGVFPQRP